MIPVAIRKYGEYQLRGECDDDHSRLQHYGTLLTSMVEEEHFQVDLVAS